MKRLVLNVMLISYDFQDPFDKVLKSIKSKINTDCELITGVKLSKVSDKRIGFYKYDPNEYKYPYSVTFSTITCEIIKYIQ